MATQQELRVRVGLDGRGFETGLRRLEMAGSRFAQNLKSQLAAAFGIAATTLFFQNVVKNVEKIKDLSEQLSITTNDVQELQFAASRSGLSFEDFGTALTRLTSARRDAAEGNDRLRASFGQFNVTLNDLQNPALTNIDLVRKIAQALRDTGMSATAAGAALRDLFGRSGERLFNALLELTKPGRAPIISPDDIRSIDEASKKLDVLILKLKVLGARILGSAIDDKKQTFLGGLMAPLLGLFGDVEKGVTRLTEAEKSFPSGRQPTRATMMNLQGQLFPEKEKMDSGSIRKQLIELAPHLNELQRIGGAGGERGRLVQTVEVTNRKLDEANKNLRQIENRIQEKEAL